MREQESSLCLQQVEAAAPSSSLTVVRTCGNNRLGGDASALRAAPAALLISMAKQRWSRRNESPDREPSRGRESECRCGSLQTAARSFTYMAHPERR